MPIVEDEEFILEDIKENYQCKMTLRNHSEGMLTLRAVRFIQLGYSYLGLAAAT
jgi:hypothetical protein